MPRCPHACVTVKDENVVWLEFHIADGQLIGDWAPMAAPTGRFWVKCEACGYEREFRVGGRMPAWVAATYQVATGREES